MEKKVLAFVLAMAMLFGMTGCQKNEQSGNNNPSKNTQTETPRMKYAYQPEYIPLDFGEAEMQYINNFCISGGMVYFYGNCKIGEEPWIDEYTGEPVLDENGEPYMNAVVENRIYSMDLATNQLTQLEGYSTDEIPEGYEGNTYINNIFAGNDNTVWISQNTYTYYFDLPEDFNPETDDRYTYYTEGDNSNTLIQLDASGTALQTITVEMPETGYINNMIVADNGDIYACDWESLMVYGPDGKLKQTMEAGVSINSLVKLGDGTVALNAWKENDGNYLIDVDWNTLTLGEETKLAPNAYNLYPGRDEYDYIYNNGGTYYGYLAKSGESEKIFSWLDWDVDDSNLSSTTVMLPDGTVYTMESIYDTKTEKNTFSLIKMEQVDPSTIPVKQELTLACFYLDWELRSRIVEFNKSRDDVHITINEYSQFGTDEDYRAGLQKLNTEIISGIVPDIFLINGGMPVEQYIAKGVLMDLWPLIDSDPELSREDLMTHLFDAMSVDDKLYYLTDKFYITTVAGKASVVGDGDSWTMEDLRKVLDQMPEGTRIFSEYDTKQSVLDDCIARNIDTFIDWNTQQCSFDSQAFIDLLNFANQFPMEYSDENLATMERAKMEATMDIAAEEWLSEAELLRSGKQLLYRIGLSTFDTFQWTEQVFGEEANFIGYPSSAGNGSSFTINSSLALSSTCSNVDAAWDFVRTYLTEEHQTSEYMYSFPTNKHSFDTMAKRAMTPDYETDPVTGEQVERPKNNIWYSDSEQTPIYAMTQEELDRFMELYNATSGFYSYNDEINNLVKEETEPFFNGQKTAEETAKLIQDRVGLYVFENG